MGLGLTHCRGRMDWKEVSEIMPYKDPAVRRTARARYRDENRDKIREYARQYAENNRVNLRKARAQWRANTREQRAEYRIRFKKKFLLYHVKSRARKRGIPFNLTEANVFWPSVCPVFGTPLDYKSRGTLNPDAPTIDRIDPHGGYLAGNVQVLSWRANRLKSDATPEELRKLADYVEIWA